MCGYCGRKLEDNGEGIWSCPRCRPLLRTIGQGANLDTARGREQWHREWTEFLRSAEEELTTGQGTLL